MQTKNFVNLKLPHHKKDYVVTQQDAKTKKIHQQLKVRNVQLGMLNLEGFHYSLITTWMYDWEMNHNMREDKENKQYLL